MLGQVVVEAAFVAVDVGTARVSAVDDHRDGSIDESETR
jgi:hypothetical protein